MCNYPRKTNQQMCLKSLFIDHVRATLFTLLSRTMNRFFQPAITAVLLSAALVVIAVTLLSGSVAQGAATYMKRNGTIVDPIMDIYGSPHSYSGNNLEPSAWLPGANLIEANLDSAYLSSADLTGAYLEYANLEDADLIGADLEDASLNYASLTYAYLGAANLTYAYLYSAELTGASLTGANLTGADLDSAYLYNANLDSATFSLGTTLYDGQTVLQHGFDTAGLQAYLEAYPVNASSAANIILVPEPHTLLLASLASMGLTLRRRRSAR